MREKNPVTHEEKLAYLRELREAAINSASDEAVEGVEVSMAEKGFGTRVQIRADEAAGLEAADLEAFLDRLAEPQRRPFSSV